MPNALAQATSPYLLQHQDNPVDWQEWNEATLARARAERKPILLSVGYAACHWCHVMAHESFEQPGLAELMNRHFVNIKVDREERPDVDAVYQQALAVMGQQGGWPLTMFLTPDRRAVLGRDLFPARAALRPAGLRAGAGAGGRALARAAASGSRATAPRSRRRCGGWPASEPGEPLPAALASEVARAVAERFDTVHGRARRSTQVPAGTAPAADLGDGAADRRPDAAAPDRPHARRASRRAASTTISAAASRATPSMPAGWCRISRRCSTTTPSCSSCWASAWAATREPLFAARADETVAWLQREMMVDGAFAAALDADSEGEEGRYYVWSAEEIDRLLGAAAPAFRLAYGVTRSGNWEGSNVLNRLHEPGLPPDEARAASRVAPDPAGRPGRPYPAEPGRQGPGGLERADDRGAWPQASGHLGRPNWLDLARGAFAAVLRHMGDGDRLSHSWRAGRRLPMAFLDDYAQMSRAALALYEQTGEPSYLERARAWVERCRQDFRDETAGGYFLSAPASDGPIVRPKNAQDGPTPVRQRHARRRGGGPLASYRRGSATACRPRRSWRPSPGKPMPASAATPRFCSPPRCWPSRCRSSLWATRRPQASPSCSPSPPQPPCRRESCSVWPPTTLCRRPTRRPESAFSTAAPPPMSASAAPARRRSPIRRACAARLTRSIAAN